MKNIYEALPRKSIEEIEELEAFQVLRGLARGKLGGLPPEMMARHILRINMDADWPVQRTALDAIVRRWAFAHRDRLEVGRRPRGRIGLGLYRTKKHGEDLRPYQTQLAALNPLVGSCDCKDFQKSGLGLCKHLLVVLEDLRMKSSKWKRAMDAGLDAEQASPRLRWDPRCPLRGVEDWMDRISWWPGRDTTPKLPGVIEQFFSRRREDGAWVLRGGAADDFANRLQLAEALLEFLLERASEDPGVGDDPALKPLFEREIRRLERRARGLKLVDRLDAQLKKLKRPLYAYQREGVARFLGAGRLLLADDMGLGKTIQAIAACDVLWRSGRVRRGLLLVPAPLKSQWEREWTLFSDAPVRIIEGRSAQRASIYAEQQEGFLIGNYEQLFRDLALMYQWAPEMMVLDEAQRIKNWATKTAVYVKQLDPEYRLVLTGTPMENRLDELASVMDWVNERAMEPKWRMTPWYMTLWNGREAGPGARNLDTLRSRLADSLVRRVRKEVLDQLPPRTDTRVPVELSQAQYREHEDLSRPIAIILQKARRRPLTQAEFLRLMQMLATQRIICNGLAQLQFDDLWPELSTMNEGRDTILKSLDSPKLIELRELIRQLVLEGGQKVVVFSQWRRMLKLAEWAVGDILTARGYRTAFFTGAESQKSRTQNVVEFHDDPTLAVLFASDAGGVGLNLQRAASSVINLELPWNPAVLEQRIGRVYRLGQKLPVQIYNLVSEGGIETRIARIIDDKQLLFSGLFDGSSDELTFSSSNRFLDTIEKLVPQVEAPELGEIEEVLDPVAPPARTSVAEDGGTVVPVVPPVEEAVAAPGTTERPGPREDRAPAAEPPSTPKLPIEELFASINVERTAGGGLKIEAEPEAAGTLAAMFQGMADLLMKAAQGR